MSNIVIVRWVKKKAPYNIGEQCGLTEDQAAAEIKKGNVQLVSKSKKSDKRDSPKTKSSKGKSKGSNTVGRRRVKE